MAKRVHIVIAEPSAIIRCGLVTLFQQVVNMLIEITEVSDITTISSISNRQNFDILIINPSHLGLFSPNQLKSDIGNNNLKIIALQSNFMEQSLLQNYDDAFTLYDSIETIIDKVKSVTEDAEDNQIKKELSIREKEIIVCVVKGMTNKQIAETLFLSTHTVIAHRRNIANKLQIHSPSGLTIYAIVNKLVNLADIKNSISTNRESES